MLNDDYKISIKSTQSLDNVRKQVNVPMTQLVDSYASVKEQRNKLSKLILEKGVGKINIHHIATPIKVVSQVPLKYTIIQYRNIFKDLQTTVEYVVFELLNTMRHILIETIFY